MIWEGQVTVRAPAPIYVMTDPVVFFLLISVMNRHDLVDELHVVQDFLLLGWFCQMILTCVDLLDNISLRTVQCPKVAQGSPSPGLQLPERLLGRLILALDLFLLQLWHHHWSRCFGLLYEEIFHRRSWPTILDIIHCGVTNKLIYGANLVAHFRFFIHRFILWYACSFHRRKLCRFVSFSNIGQIEVNNDLTASQLLTKFFLLQLSWGVTLSFRDFIAFERHKLYW